MSLPRTCMRDQIRKAVLARILDGSYVPGTRLKEMALAQEFNVSQAPVREALRELESLGLVETKRYRGTYIRAVSPDETREAYELRACLEESAAQLAVPAREADLAALQGDVDGLVAAAREPDLEAYAQHNLNFHRRIVSMSRNSVMLRVWDSLGWEVRSRVMLQSAHRHRHFLAAVKKHQVILDFLKAGDGVAAGKLLRTHAEAFIEKAAPDAQPDDARVAESTPPVNPA